MFRNSTENSRINYDALCAVFMFKCYKWRMLSRVFQDGIESHY